MYLAEGVAHAKHVRIKSRRRKSTILEMVLDEGRNREIRRLLARVGHKVQRLKRVAVGPVRLGDLPLGAVRPLTRKEIQSLERAVARGKAAHPTTKTVPNRQASRRNDSIHRKGHVRKPGRRIIN
jgi:23S rRNA pseudouridine2605 synthase